MKTIRILTRVWIIAAALLFSGFLRTLPAAAQDLLYEGQIDREEAVRSAAAVTREAYPDADLVEVDTHRRVRYREDGTYEEWLETWFKILTEKGRREFRTVSSYFTIPYNTTEFKLLEVIGPDGTGMPVEIGPNSREMVESGQMGSNIYNPNDRVLQVSIPQLNIGDMVHYIIFDRFDKTRMPDTWSDHMGFESTHPIVRSVCTVIAPARLPLRSIAVKNEIPGVLTHSRKEESDSIRYVWTARNVPMAFMEPDMPPFYSLQQRVLVSTIPDWQWISRWYWALSLPHLEKTTPEMEQAVQRLIAGAGDRETKIRRLFNWVSQNIRYLGLTVETEAPGYEPHPVSMTFESKAGVCRDKAALLVAMLRLAELEAYPVLIMNGPKKDPEVPQPFFNHAVVAVREPGGGYLLMDPTDENAKDLFPSYLNDQSYLVATPEGDGLRLSPIDPIEQNMMDIQTTAGIDADGTLNATSVLEFNGINDNAYRGYFARLSPDERRAFFEKLIQRISPGARLKEIGISPADMQNTSQRLEVKLSYEAKEFPIKGRQATLLPVMRIGGQLGMVHFILGKMSLDERKYPIRTEYACGVREALSIDISHLKGDPLSLPRFKPVGNDGASWIIDLDQADRRLVGNSIFMLKLPEYSPEQYLALKETLKHIETDVRRMPILSAPAPSDDLSWQGPLPPDAVVLDESIAYDLTDDRNWTETISRRIRVMTYAGMKENSDLSIAYNPAWEDVRVERASVRSPAGDVKEIQPHEINLMDAGWVGKAPRYPAGKSLVVSLPGVTPGSEIDYVIRKSLKNQPFFSACQVFRKKHPVLKKTVTVRVPKRLKPRIVVSENGIGLDAGAGAPAAPVIAHRTETVGDAVVHTFEASRVKPFRRENDLPAAYMFNPCVLITTGNWNLYAQDIRNALEKAALSQTATVEKTAELIGGIDGVDDRIKAIRDFAAKNIRRVGLLLDDLPLDAISPADRTLSDGYGHPADAAVLMHAMLQAAGIQSDFVIASDVSPLESMRQTMRKYPDPGWFNRVLVRIKTDEGDIFLNDTDQYAVPGTTAADGWPGLFLSSNQIGGIAARRAELKDFETVDYSIRLFEDGGAIIKKTRKLFGNPYAAFRRSFTEITPEKRRRHHLDQVVSISRSARPVGDYITNYDSYPGVETFSARVDDYAIRQGDYLYLGLPGLIRGIEGVFRDARELPLYRPQRNRARIAVEVLLPQGMESIAAAPPEDMRVAIKDGGEIAIRCVRKEVNDADAAQGVAARLVIEEDIQLAPFVVMPEDYPGLMDAHQRLGQPETRTVLIKMKKQAVAE